MIQKIRYSLAFFCLVVLSSGFKSMLHAQENLPPGQYTSSNKKALKYFSEGKRFYDARQDKKAEEYFLKAIETDNTFVEPHVIISILCLEQNRTSERIYHLNQAIQKGPKIYVENYFNLAETEFGIEEYDKAKTHYMQFLRFTRINPDDKDEAGFKIRCCDFALEAKKNPKKINFTNMGPAVNSQFSEYFPTLTADENTFYFTRRLDCEQCYSRYQEDLFVTRRVNAEWDGAKAVRELSSNGNEGAPSVSADGNYMFITISQEMDGSYMGGQSTGLGSCDIFYTQKVNGRWTKPVNLGPKINSANWETQPSFSSDGKTLYFIRGTPMRNGTVKNIDIYFSQVGEDGKFSQAEKLPSNINSTKNEQSVFIHPDNQTLYFSSEGHVGMGGLDIFMSKRKADGSWSDPVNLGYPINSAADENSLLVAPGGKLAYFASDRSGGFGLLDLYQFNLPEELKPEAITYVKGKVINAKTGEALEANFELYDLETQNQVTKSYSQKNGEFLVTLTANKNYLVNVNKAGFLFYSDNFSLKGVNTSIDKPYRLDIALEPIDVGSVVELKNIFFEVNKWDLKPESRAELGKLSAFLNQNPGLKVELSGHTDNSGDKKQNDLLSNNRAKAVYDYLMKEAKIPAERLSYKGYGDSQPKVPNDSPEHKARNRRTEFKIISR
ncbi:MAG TPA: OmpA family protein [Bacteroidia bacterium]|nr:OmpA family protein [Bacteroidia bacterium]